MRTFNIQTPERVVYLHDLEKDQHTKSQRNIDYRLQKYK